MNIVLATPPDLSGNWGAGSFPPMGLVYLATAVKDIPGVRVRIVDSFGEGLDADSSLDRVLELSPDVLGLSPTSMTFRGAWELVRRVKNERPSVLNVMGGLHATLFDKLLLQEIKELDFVFRGEAEISLREFCIRLTSGEGLEGIPGVSYRANGKVVQSETQLIENLDSLPFPDRGTLDYQGYGTQWAGFKFPRLPRFTTLVSSRGCIYRCSFCSDKILSQSRWRPHSAERVFQEIRDLSRSGYEMVLIVDENFTANVRRVNRICEMLIHERVDIRFGVQGSLHHVPDSTLRLMHRAGCDAVFVGVESGSDAQLRRYNKPATSRGMAAGLLRAKKAHMIVVSSFITGAPGETRSDLDATLQFLRDVRPHYCETGPLRIHPGSRLWEEMIGREEPRSVEESLSRRIDTLSGQPDRETLYGWIREFRRTHGQCLMNWRTIPELVDLLLYNPTVRRFVAAILSDPWVVIRMLRHA